MGFRSWGSERKAAGVGGFVGLGCCDAVVGMLSLGVTSSGAEGAEMSDLGLNFSRLWDLEYRASWICEVAAKA